MADKRISIIIPVYNVENYISECVESVINQTYKALQIILVDDGSADESGKICDSYAEKDPRILVIHKENGGLSDARNAGTARADGDFVFYLDSDDFLSADSVRVLTDLQASADADLTIGSFFYRYDSHTDTAKTRFAENVVFSNGQAMRELVRGNLETFAWGKLIRTEIAKAHPFPEGKLFEDHFWTHYVFGDCSKIAFTPSPLVYYRQRENSISYTYNEKRLDVMDGWADRLRYLEQNYPELLPDYKKTLSKRYLETAWQILTRMKKGKRNAYDRMRRFNAANRLQEYAEGQSKALIDALDKGTVPYALLALRNRVVSRS